MSSLRLSLFEYLEDFDNSELAESDWLEQMRSAVMDFNAEFGTEYQPHVMISNYQSWKREKQSQ